MSYEPQQPVGGLRPVIEAYPEPADGVIEVGRYPQNQAFQHIQYPQYPEAVPENWGQLEVVPPPLIQESIGGKASGGTILGVKKTNFWLLELFVIVVVIAAVGGGVGGALASKKRSPAAADVVTATVTSTINNGNVRRTSSNLLHNTATDATATPTIFSSSTAAATATTTGGLENKYQVIKTDMTAPQYDVELKKWTGLGYQLTGLSGYGLNSEDRYAAIWEQRAGPAFSTKNGLNSTQYQSEFDSITSQGYIPVLVDGWNVNGADHYAAIWRNLAGTAAPTWAARHGLNTTEFKAESDKWTSQGYCIKVLSGYAVGAGARYAAIWYECPTGTAANATVFRYAMSPGQYHTEAGSLAKQGYRISYVNGFAVDNIDYYNVIFTLGSVTEWFAIHGYSLAGFQTKLEEMAGADYNMSLVSCLQSRINSFILLSGIGSSVEDMRRLWSLAEQSDKCR